MGPRQRSKALPPRIVLLAFLLAFLVLGAACGDNADAQSAAQAEQGRQVYRQNCAVCHGAKGEGQPDWQFQRPDGSYPAPPHDNTGHTWHHSDGLLFRIVKYGGASLNIPNYRSGMPAFDQRLSDEEIQAVVNHLKTFWGTEQREFQRQASKQDAFPREVR